MENLDWGIKMTVLGMGLVFSLLGLLWALLTVILMFDKEEVAESHEEADAGADEPQAAAASVLTADLVSAIVVATLKHKKTLRGGAASLMKTTWSGSQSSLWLAAGRARQTNNWISRGR